jgi:hypothetical protein
MRHILLFLLAFWCISLNAQIPTALNLRFGDSELKGLLGAEVEVYNFSLSGGWRPARIPFGKTFHSFNTALTYYVQAPPQASYFASVGIASKGYIWLPYPYTDFTKYDLDPSLIVLLGCRLNMKEYFPRFNDRFYIDFGLGYFFTGYNSGISFEALINYRIFDNYKRKY